MEECDHLLGIYNSGLGSETVLIYADDESIPAYSPNFLRFKYCSRCGKQLKEEVEDE